jgi:hypothetical protein
MGKQKLAAENTRDVMEWVRSQSRPALKPHGLQDWFGPALTSIVIYGGMAALIVMVVIAARREHHPWESSPKSTSAA